MKNQPSGRGALIAVAAITILAFTGCSSQNNSSQSGENRILVFTINGRSGGINHDTGRITVVLAAGTDAGSLTPTIAVSDKATVIPGSGVAQDFTEPVSYRVTAENGTARTYSAAVTLLPADLDTALDEAADAKSEIVTAGSAEEVPEGTEWVPQEALDDLNEAIARAESVAAKPDATDEEKADSLLKLAEAIADFENAKQTGTKTGTEAVNKAALTGAIAAANAAKAGIALDTTAGNVSAGTSWVTQAEMTALNTAISAAETVSTNVNATQAQADEAANALTAAVTTFNAAKKAGTFVAVTGIAFTVPTNGTRGYPASLAGATAQPATATYTAIVWTLKTATDGTITGATFTPAVAGEVTLVATIANGTATGTAYSQEFKIAVKAPGTLDPPTVGLGEYPSISLKDGAGAPLPYDEPVYVTRGTEYSVHIDGSGYADIAWYLNGEKQTVTSSLIYLDTAIEAGTVKTIKLTEMLTNSGHTGVDDDVVDAIGEIVNIIAGNVKKDLEEAFRLVISLPTIVQGREHSVKWPANQARIICIPFTIFENTTFNLSVAIEAIAGK